MADHPLKPSTLSVRAVIVTPMDALASEPPFLIVEIEVGCEVCGGFSQRIAGHHVLALAQVLTEVAESNPTLVGHPIVEERTKRTQWEGRAPGRGKETVN